MSTERPLAPFGRRIAPITAAERHGAYVVLRCADLEGPDPAPGQFYMLAAAARWGGGESERPFLPRAFSVLRAVPDQRDQLLARYRDGKDDRNTEIIAGVLPGEVVATRGSGTLRAELLKNNLGEG